MTWLEPGAASDHDAPAGDTQSVPRVGIARNDETGAAVARQPRMDVIQVETIDLRIDLQCDTAPASGLEDGFDVKGIGFAFENQAARRVTEDVDVGVLD